MQGGKTELHINNLIRNLKKRIDNIGSLIESLCKKKIVFARPLLLFGTVWEALAHCTHLQIALADPTIQNLQKSAIFANAQWCNWISVLKDKQK